MSVLATVANHELDQVEIITVFLSSDDEERVKQSTYQCSFCGQVVPPYVAEILNKTVIVRRRCLCEQKNGMAKEQAYKAYEQKEKLENKFKESMMAARFQDCTFNNWERTIETEAMYKEIVDFVENHQKRITESDGLILCGNKGVGKTHLFSAATKKLILHGVNAVYINSPQFLERIRTTFQKNSTETKDYIMKNLLRNDVIILDDLGAEKLTEWTEETLYLIVDGIYANKKTVMVGTNYMIEDICKQVGDRSLDRLIEMCRIIECTAPSYREKIAKERAVKRAKN